jgi:protein disulfide-isomerase
MKRETWCNDSIRRRIASGFVAIRLSPRKNAATLNRIDVKMYPMTLIGVPRGKVIGHRRGYQPPADLHQLLTEAKNRPGLLR